MELDSSYTAPTFPGLETSVIESYREGIKKLRESADSQEQLNILRGMFSALGKSHAGFNGVVWAKDRMQMYQNLGKILGGITGTSKGYSYWLNLVSEYGGIGPIKDDIERLKGIEEILKAHNIDGNSELEKKLESTPLQGTILKYANLLNDYMTGNGTDVESIENALEELQKINNLLEEHGFRRGGEDLILELKARLDKAEQAESLERL